MLGRNETMPQGMATQVPTSSKVESTEFTSAVDAPDD
jgi:hypothetical protein